MTPSDRTAKLILAIDRFALGCARHWLLSVNVLFGIFVLAPFAAPVLMAIGATRILSIRQMADRGGSPRCAF